MSRLDAKINAATVRLGRRVLTVQELLDEGATYAEIRRRVDDEIWQRVHDGVIAIGPGNLSWDEEVLAATQAGGETAQAARRAAARLYDLADYGALVEICVTHGTEIHAEGVIVYRTRRLTPATIIRGIPTTGIEETLLDLAAMMNPREVHRLFTRAWRQKHTTPDKVLTHIEHHGGRGVKGTRVLREVAQMYKGVKRPPGSDYEALLVFLLRPALAAAGIEDPVLQFSVKIHGGQAEATVDAGWPDRGKLVEMVGLDAHGDAYRQDYDVERAAALRAAGYELEEVTPRQIRERPDSTIRRLIRFLQTPNPKTSGRTL